MAAVAALTDEALGAAESASIHRLATAFMINVKPQTSRGKDQERCRIGLQETIRYVSKGQADVCGFATWRREAPNWLRTGFRKASAKDRLAIIHSGATLEELRLPKVQPEFSKCHHVRPVQPQPANNAAAAPPLPLYPCLHCRSPVAVAADPVAVMVTG